MSEGSEDVALVLEDRYGTGRRRRFDRRFAWVVAAALVAAGIGFLLFSGWHETSRVEWQDIGFTKRGELAVDVKYHVSGPPDASVACAVEALNTSKATVGWKVVTLPPSEDRSQILTTDLVLTTPATAASVRECWILE